MLKIKTKELILNFKGEPLKNGEEELTIGELVSDVLAFHNENPARCWQLGKKFAIEEEVELKAEDVVFIKNALEKASTGERAFKNAMACGQVIEILEEKD